MYTCACQGSACLFLGLRETSDAGEISFAMELVGLEAPYNLPALQRVGVCVYVCVGGYECCKLSIREMQRAQRHMYTSACETISVFMLEGV